MCPRSLVNETSVKLARNWVRNCIGMAKEREREREREAEVSAREARARGNKKKRTIYRVCTKALYINMCMKRERENYIKIAIYKHG